MRSFQKTVISASCAFLICAGVISWRVYRAKDRALKLAEDVKIQQMNAKRGDAQSQAKLGDMYLDGQGTPQDYAQALYWCRKAAEQGDAGAQYCVARMYYHGQGTPKDYAEALLWYRKAAIQGYAQAQEAVGFMYYRGEGVAQDYTEALRWYRKSADQGYARAQYNIGIMYYYGRGLPQDRAEAISWYRKAAAGGDEYALRALGVDLTMFVKLALLVQFLGSIWLLFDLLPPNSVVSKKSFTYLQKQVIAWAGALGVFAAALSYYGYASHRIRCLSCGFDAFNLCRWLLNTVWVVSLFYIVRSGRRSDVARGEVDPSST
jgi:Sel1 repeat